MDALLPEVCMVTPDFPYLLIDWPTSYTVQGCPRFQKPNLRQFQMKLTKTAFAPISQQVLTLNSKGDKLHQDAKNNGTCATKRGRWTCETVVVAGATGGVGRLVVNRLVAQSKMRQSVLPNTNELRVTEVVVLSRDLAQAKQIFPTNDSKLKIVELEKEIKYMDDKKVRNEMRSKLAGAAVLVICTGTTAFPTLSWRGGNTPKAVDDRFVYQLVNSVDEQKIRRIVLFSSIGTSLKRRRGFPFAILNAFGVLDAKAQGESHVRQVSDRLGCSYAIVHAGRLVGEPHTNIGSTRLKPNPNYTAISVAHGDVLYGSLSRTAAADCVLYATIWGSRSDFEFSAVHKKGSPPTIEEWQELLQSVEVPRKS